ARPHDIIAFRLRLHEAYGALLNFVRIMVTLGNGQGRIVSSGLIEWPTIARATNTFESATTDPVRIRLTVGGGHGLEYVPGSAVLLKPGAKLLARLPDGIADAGGVVLRNVGSPP